MDRDAFDRWFGPPQIDLHGAARRIVRDRAEADDIVQDAWLRWLEREGIALRSPSAWLATTTRCLAIDRLRHLSVVRRHGAHPEVDATGPSTEQLAIARDDAAHALRRVAAVPTGPENVATADRAGPACVPSRA